MGNLIGTAADGVASVPNTGNGIIFNTTSTGNFVGSIAAGAGNVIAFNTLAGVSVAAGAQNHLRSNRIFSNGGLGIDLGTTGVTPNDTNDTDTGANNLQNFPVLTSAVANGTNTTIQGTLNSTPNATFVIEFFEGGADPSGFGEGAIPLGRLTVVTDGTGNVSFTATVANATASVTATATDVPGNTSEFSAVRALTIPPQTFTVSNLNDSGAGSFRQAIVSANASTGTLDTIAFSTTGTIALQTALPIINDPVIIDGTTAPGFAGQPVVEINGSLLPDPYGLHITAGNSTVRGLVISGFGARAGSTNGIGIVLENFGNNVVEGNYIGTDLTGQVAKGNLSYGVFMDGDNNRIGGTTAAARNVISGNMASGVGMNSGANNNIVQGNFIGLDRTGTADLGNGLHGINAFSSSSNTIGGPASSDRNVISGNSGHGILLSLANNNTILGNYIGTNSAGTADRGNGQDGVNVQGNNNTVGGTAPGAGNVVSGNNQVGISVQNGSTNSIIGNQIGVNAAGGAALANSSHGVTVVAAATGTVIQGNVISGNTVGGVFLSGSSGSVVQNNFIGTASDGTTLIANQANGVFVSSSSSNTIGKTAVGAGTGNVIAGNGLRGIAVQPPATNNVILGNSIFSNGALGIDLGNNGVTPNDTNDTDTGANNLQNFPALTGALLGGTLEIAGSLNSVLGRPYVLEFFRSTSCDSLGFGEGQVFLGQTVLGATGQLTTPFTASFPATGVAAGQFITATATSSDGTSEFSQCLEVLSATPTTYMVTNTNVNGPGSMHQAILNSNATPSAIDTIAFNIPGAGPHTIAPTVALPLPVITAPVVIDGTTEPDFVSTPVIELDGTGAGGTTNGLWVQGGATTIRGLAINRFGTGGSGGGGAGIVLQGTGNHVVEGNFIGTDVTGTIARPNRVDGIWIDSPSNRIGGAVVSARNLISGNGRIGIEVTGAAAVGNVIQGNYIGVDRTGVADLGNTSSGIDVSSARRPSSEGQAPALGTSSLATMPTASPSADRLPARTSCRGTLSGPTQPVQSQWGMRSRGSWCFGSNNTIGGTAPGAGNVLAGNRFGLWINSGANNVVQGNFVGTNAARRDGLGKPVDWSVSEWYEQYHRRHGAGRRQRYRGERRRWTAHRRTRLDRQRGTGKLHRNQRDRRRRARERRAGRLGFQ